MVGIVFKYIVKNMVLFFIMKVYESGIIYVYDIDYFFVFLFINCCLVDLKGMFENGFKFGNV